MTSHSDYTTYGFRTADIHAFLRRNNITVADDTPQPPASAAPEWAKPFIDRRRIRIGVVAEILAGFDPTIPGLYSDEADARISAWMDTLVDAVDAGLIDGSTWGADRHEQTLSQDDVRAWCEGRGHIWPVPGLKRHSPSVPFDDPELPRTMERIQADLDNWIAQDPRAADLKSACDAYSGLWRQSKAEAENLREQLAANAASANDLQKSGESVERIAQLEEELAQAQRETERLKALVPPQPEWLMKIAIAVQCRYWGSNWQAEDRDTWTTKADIVEWLKQAYPGLSEAQRNAVDMVACPVNRDPSAKKRQP